MTASTATEIIPAEHDARQFALIQKLYKVEDSITAGRLRMHYMVGDKETGRGRSRRWGMGFAEVSLRLAQLRDGEDAILRGYSVRPSEVLAQDAALLDEMAALDAQVEEMEKTWRQHRWSRWYPCLNADGHIHRSLSGCPTVNRGMSRTSMGWATELSGKTTAEAIAELGPTLCSVCFPEAPVEHCQSRSDITRGEREAAKARVAAERAAALAPKMLAEGECFTSRRDGDRITKVSQLLALVSRAVEERVELEWLMGDKGTPRTGWSDEFLARRRENQAGYVAQADEDAAQAERILLAREAANPGWGATADKIAKRRATKERNDRRGYGLA